MGEKEVIEHFQIKEYNGKVVTSEGVKLNLSIFLMILRNSDILDRTLDKILKGKEGLNCRIHIWGSYCISVNSPYIYIFGVLRCFQHCTGHITTGSWEGRRNQYIQLVSRSLYCKLLTNGKTTTNFPTWGRAGNRNPASEVGGKSGL